MCKGISILRSRIRQELFDQYELAERIRTRDSHVQRDMFHEEPQLLPSFEDELHFMYSDRIPQLPVIDAGQLVICEWGNRGRKTSRKLPPYGWCRLDSLEAGKWQGLRPEKVVIPAQYGLENGVWFAIEQGVEGILVRDEHEQPHVYMMTDDSTVYFQNMTRHDRMPVLIGQEI